MTRCPAWTRNIIAGLAFLLALWAYVRQVRTTKRQAEQEAKIKALEKERQDWRYFRERSGFVLTRLIRHEGDLWWRLECIGPHSLQVDGIYREPHDNEEPLHDPTLLPSLLGEGSVIYVPAHFHDQVEFPLHIWTTYKFFGSEGPELRGIGRHVLPEPPL
jgi:hypothetical protein